jgi:hypothetical protein
MNKEEKERYPYHDLVEYDGGYDTFVEGLNSRYEEGDLKKIKKIHVSPELDISKVYKMNTDREWVQIKLDMGFDGYVFGIAQKTFIETNPLDIFVMHYTDYIFPSFNKALLSRSRTAKLRVKRVKPAYIGKKEEEEEE